MGVKHGNRVLLLGKAKTNINPIISEITDCIIKVIHKGLEYACAKTPLLACQRTYSLYYFIEINPE